MTLEEYRFSLTILSALGRALMQRLHKFAVGGRIFQIHFFQIVVHHLFLIDISVKDIILWIMIVYFWKFG